jgi:hypothetical protein
VVCPPQLFDGLIWLADRRLAVITVKLRPELAAIARRRLWGSRTQPPVLTWASMRLVHIRE